MYLQWLEVCMMQANVLPNQNWIYGGVSSYFYTPQRSSVNTCFRENGFSLIGLCPALTKIVFLKQFGTIKFQAGAHLSAKETSLLWEH